MESASQSEGNGPGTVHIVVADVAVIQQIQVQLSDSQILRQGHVFNL